MADRPQVQSGSQQRTNVLDERLSTRALDRQYVIFLTVSLHNHRKLNHVCSVNEHRQNEIYIATYFLVSCMRLIKSFMPFNTNSVKCCDSVVNSVS